MHLPGALASQPDSRYQTLLAAEEAVRVGLWQSADWRRLLMAGGRLTETDHK